MGCQGGLIRNIIDRKENVTKGREWVFVLKLQKYSATTVATVLSIKAFGLSPSTDLSTLLLLL